MRNAASASNPRTSTMSAGCISGDLLTRDHAAELHDRSESIERLQLLEKIARLALLHPLRRALLELVPEASGIDGALEMAARILDRLGCQPASVAQQDLDPIVGGERRLLRQAVGAGGNLHLWKHLLHVGTLHEVLADLHQPAI